MRVSRLDMRLHTLPEFQRMRFAQIDRPCLFSNKEPRIKTNGNPESDQVQNALIQRSQPLVLVLKSPEAPREAAMYITAMAQSWNR